jgi:hypothetical protein
MAPKHLYTDEASKGAFLIFLKNGESIPFAAKKAKINIKIVRNIKKRADKIIIYCDEHSLPSFFFSRPINYCAEVRKTSYLF